MKLHKQIIQDWINPQTKNHVDLTIRTQVIPNLGVHTFIDRQVLKTQLNLTEFELFQFYGTNFIKFIKAGAASREAGAAQAGEP